jgi:hypothetical protein
MRMVGWQTYFIVCLVLTGIGIGICSWIATARDFRRRFDGRPTVDIDSVARSRWPEDADFVRKLWPRLEVALTVPRGKMRPEDKFSEELRPNPKFALYQTSFDALDEIRKLTLKAGLRCEIHSVADYIDACMQLLGKGYRSDQLLRVLP